MKVKEIFKNIGVSQSFQGVDVFLDNSNCSIIKMIKNADSIRLRLKRNSGAEEGQAYLRVLDIYKSKEREILEQVSNLPSVIGLTINELPDLETGINVDSQT